MHLLSNRSIQILSPLITNWSYLPFTNFAAGPLFYAHICNEIIINDRKNIVELGSGISTILIARLIHINKLKINFFSIDHDSNWQLVIQKILKADGIDTNVKFLSSPIKQYEQYSWYDHEKLNIDITIDMLIVDGPPGYELPFARFGAVPFFKNKLSTENYSIFLHDTDRNYEAQTIIEWSKILGLETLEKSLRYSVLRFGNAYTTFPQTIL